MLVIPCRGMHIFGKIFDEELLITNNSQLNIFAKVILYHSSICRYIGDTFQGVV